MWSAAWIYLMIGCFFAGVCFDEYKDDKPVIMVGWITAMTYLWPLSVFVVVWKGIKERRIR